MFTLRRQATASGQFERLMLWGRTLNNIRIELPRWEAALAKLELDLGPIKDTLKIGLLRKNSSPAIQHYLRLHPDVLQEFQHMKDLVVEWDRSNDFTTARHSGTSSSNSAPIDIGTTLTRQRHNLEK